MGRLHIYLHFVDFYGFHVGKYTIVPWILWVLSFPLSFPDRWKSPMLKNVAQHRAKRRHGEIKVTRERERDVRLFGVNCNVFLCGAFLCVPKKGILSSVFCLHTLSPEGKIYMGHHFHVFSLYVGTLSFRVFVLLGTSCSVSIGNFFRLPFFGLLTGVPKRPFNVHKPLQVFTWTLRIYM